MEYETITATIHFRDPEEHEDITFDEEKMIDEVCEKTGCSREKAEACISAEFEFIEEKGIEAWADLENQDVLYRYCAKKSGLSAKKAGNAICAAGAYMVKSGFLSVVWEGPSIDEETGLLGEAEVEASCENKEGEKAARFKLTSGSLSPGTNAVILRDGNKIHEGRIKRVTLGGLVDCVMTRTNTSEQTIAVEDWEDIEPGDIIKCYQHA